MTSKSMARPEESGPADNFYNETEAKKYIHSSRMIEVQTNMAERALEMLCIREDEPSLLLDVGCGTGLSGEVLEEAGHSWIGCDISRDMLGCARRDRDVEGDLVHDDMGRGLPFRQGMFDGAISISAVQWLCYSNSEKESPRLRLHRFFQSLYRCLRRGARAVLQFYPQDADQLQMITAAAMRAGFGGGLVIDFPHSTKAKKYFLCLLAGPPDAGFQMPTAAGDDVLSMAGASTVAGNGWGATQHSSNAVRNEGRQHAKRKMDSRTKSRHGKIAKKSREWIMIKKDNMRKHGREVANDSKYTGRKRSKVKF